MVYHIEKYDPAKHGTRGTAGVNEGKDYGIIDEDGMAYDWCATYEEAEESLAKVTAEERKADAIQGMADAITVAICHKMTAMKGNPLITDAASKREIVMEALHNVRRDYK